MNTQVPGEPFPDFPLDGKIVVITGGGSGLGLAFAKLALSKGARILIADLKLRPESEEFISSAGNSVFYEHCDVTVWKDLQKVIDVAKEKFGAVPDVYVPSAGIYEPEFSNFWQDPEDEGGYASIKINVEHPIKFTRLAIRALLGAKKKGVVLLLGSLAGILPVFPIPLYCATKHAIVGFGRSLAAADKVQGVKVVTIAPGVIKTPMMTDRIDLTGGVKLEDLPKVLDPDDVAELMAALVEKAEYPGGTVMEILLSGKRVVPLWNAAPPILPESGGRLQKAMMPVLAVTAKERGEA